MAQRKLGTVLASLVRNLKDCQRLASDAYGWSLPGKGGASPLISAARRDSIVELAFLSAFLAWESFLEESFILYLLGQKAPRGRPPRRYAFPPNKEHAVDWLSEGRDYAKWADAGQVGSRAKRFFGAGRPFSGVLSRNQNVLQEINTIRNAIAHRSGSAHDKFEKVVRGRLTTLPANLTVGSFLSTPMPSSIPPVTFLEFYVGQIDLAAREIVPA